MNLTRMILLSFVNFELLCYLGIQHNELEESNVCGLEAEHR